MKPPAPASAPSAGRVGPRRRALLLGMPAIAAARPARAAAPGCGAAGERDAGGTPPWPCRTLRIVVGYPPGGVSDQVARALAEALSGRLGVAAVVENRAGASGMLALDQVAGHRPDGHSLCFVAATAVALRERAAGMRGASVRPAVPVAGVMRTPVLVVGTPGLQAQGFDAMLEQARRDPGSIRWATTGDGTTGHAVLERVRRASGAGIVHVPYKGGGQQIADALAGHFEVLSTNVAAAQLADVRAGRLQALAVGAPHRLEVLPGTPTLAELGFPDANLDSLFGLFGPPGLPGATAAAIHRAVGDALRSGGLQARLQRMNNLPYEGSTDDFARQVAQEARR
ncbi:MAG: tripartite tricarboxylate transporter substrate binding protein [Xylophilus ampelinus]